MKRKLLALVLAAVLVAIPTGCSSKKANETSKNDQNKQNSTNEGSKEEQQSKEGWPLKNTLPIADGNVDLTIYTFIHEGAQQVYKDLSEHPVVKVMEEQTGINLHFIHPPAGDDGTFFNTTIASGVLPDIIYNDFKSYPGGPEAAMQDGVIINMNDLIDQYAYNYKNFIDSLPNKEVIMKKSLSDNGINIRFATMLQPPFLEGRVHSGLAIRKDLVKKYNMNMPVTIADYEAFFDACIKDGIKTPLAVNKISDGPWKNQNFIASAYGIPHNGFYLSATDGQVMYSRIQPQYKEYLKLLCDWYQKGYITSDFLTATKQDTQKSFKAGNAGMTPAGCWEIDTMNVVGKANNPNFEVVGAPYPRLNKEDEVHFASQMESVDSRAAFVSATCKHPAEAIRFLDYLYAEDTQLLTAWGPGNEEYPTYEIVDGKRKFTDLINNNPDADFATARARYTLNNLQIMWNNDMEKLQYEPFPTKMESWENWALNTTKAQMLPKMISPTADESRELNTLMTAIDTYTDEQILNFIVGNTPLDQFDDFVQQVKDMNIDRAIEINQAAVDRYNAR